jgi:hypothetical protein
MRVGAVWSKRRKLRKGCGLVKGKGRGESGGTVFVGIRNALLKRGSFGAKARSFRVALATNAAG